VADLTAANLWPELVAAALEVEARRERGGWGGWTPDDGLHVLLGATLSPLLEEELDRPEPSARLERLMAFLEEMAASTDERVTDVLSATVLAGLGDDPARLARARALMGPATRRASEDVEGFWAGAD
jgi:hypothetical protein